MLLHSTNHLPVLPSQVRLVRPQANQFLYELGLNGWPQEPPPPPPPSPKKGFHTFLFIFPTGTPSLPNHVNRLKCICFALLL